MAIRTSYLSVTQVFDMDGNSRYYTRAETAKLLQERGFPVAISSLATMATRGGGPPYKIFNRTPLYKMEDVMRWAEAKLSKTVVSSAELR
jgi:hypothetical protein